MKMDHLKHYPNLPERPELIDYIKKVVWEKCILSVAVSSLRFINKEIYFMLCWIHMHSSLYFAGFLNDAFVTISQVLWLICSPLRRALDISFFKPASCIILYLYLSETLLELTVFTHHFWCLCNLHQSYIKKVT